MKVKIEFHVGPNPQTVEFCNVANMRTIDYFGYSRLVISCYDGFKYSTPTYLIHKLEVETNES